MHDSLAFALSYGPLWTVGAALVGASLTASIVYVTAPLARALRLAAVSGFVVFWATLSVAVVVGEQSLRTLQTPAETLESVRDGAAVWTSAWRFADQVRLRRIAQSPVRWRAIRARYEALARFETPWPPVDPVVFEATRARLRAAHDCGHESELLLRTGRWDELDAMLQRCPEARPRALEARWSRGPEAHCAWHTPPVEGCLSEAPAVAAGMPEGVVSARLGLWWDPRKADGESVSPTADPSRCVGIAAARRLTDTPAEGWNDMLAHPHPACRILAATATTRRDEAALRALREVSTRATGSFRPLLDLARSVVSLEGMSLGRVTPVPCTTQRVVGGVDGDFLREFPMLTEVALHTAHTTRCEWVRDQLRFPAREAQAWRAALAGDGTPIAPLVSDRRERALGWDALHQDDRRFGPHARTAFQALEARVQALVPMVALGSLDEEFFREGRWTGGFTWAAVLDASVRLAPREGMRCEQGPRVLPLNPDGTPAFDPCSLRLDFRVAASMQRAQLDASLVEFWRTGEWSPSRDAPDVLTGAAMARVVAASASGDGADVLAVLGPPSRASTLRLAAVAYRITRNREVLTDFVRASLGASNATELTLVERFSEVDTVARCVARLRLAGLWDEVSRARARALAALSGAVDPWVSAVAEALLREGRGRTLDPPVPAALRSPEP